MKSIGLIFFLLLISVLAGAEGMSESMPASTPIPDSAPASATPSLPTDVAQATVDSTVNPDTLPVEIRHLTFAKLGQPVLRLRSSNGRGSVSFGIRADELVTKATLTLHFMYSPALIPVQSHIKVLLNDEIFGVIPITKEDAGHTLTQVFEIDPRFISDFNKIVLDFVGHYTNECEDSLHSSLWADVSGTSELQLSVRPVVQKNDLAKLPEPFFDARDFTRVNLPFAFSAAPSNSTLRAAAITASWFGKLANWRGARFPASLNRAPSGHAIAFATNTERPDFLNKMEVFSGPGLSILTNPGDGYSKLLLISGRNGDDLKIAATALVLGNIAMTGTHLSVTKAQQETPRHAYDAPSWVRLDRPMKFGELVESPQQLQGFGHVPDVIRMNLRMPPDLFTWRSRGVPVDLRFRYTPTIRTSESRLVTSLNDELVQAVNLRSAGQGDNAHIRLPLLDDDLQGDEQSLLIPPFKLTARNQMQFAFSFAYQKEGSCRDTPVENVRAMIDPDSTIDFSDFPHYAEMPHLDFFTTLGFPFTIYADLSQTAVILPENPTEPDIAVMLTLLGRMGESTGYPATQVSVLGPRDITALQDRDLLLIGAASNQNLLTQWGEHLPAMISGENRRISQPVRSVSFLYDWLGFDTEPDTTVATQETLSDKGPLAAVLGFESPVTPQRSVVAVTATEPGDMLQILDALDDAVLNKSMRGSVVFVHAGKVDSFLTGNTYTLGAIPFWTNVWFPLLHHPLLLAFIFVCTLLLLLYLLRRVYKAIAKTNVSDDDDD